MLPQATVRQRLQADKSATGQSVFIHPLPPVSGGRKMVFCYSELSTSLINSVLRTLHAASIHSSFLSTLNVKR